MATTEPLRQGHAQHAPEQWRPLAETEEREDLVGEATGHGAGSAECWELLEGPWFLLYDGIHWKVLSR